MAAPHTNKNTPKRQKGKRPMARTVSLPIADHLPLSLPPSPTRQTLVDFVVGILIADLAVLTQVMGMSLLSAMAEIVVTEAKTRHILSQKSDAEILMVAQASLCTCERRKTQIIAYQSLAVYHQVGAIAVEIDGLMFWI
jgi:hypothetical protein